MNSDLDLPLRRLSDVEVAIEDLVGDESLGWVSSRNFRKTAATLVEREYGIDRASKQLGHAGVAVTERHYIERARVAPNNRSALDRLAR